MADEERILIAKLRVLDLEADLISLGVVNASAVNVSGALTAGSAAVAGTLAAGSAAVAGALTAGSAAVTGPLAVTGALTAGSAAVAGPLAIAGPLTVTGAATLNGGGVLGADLDANGFSVVNLRAPVAAADAATKLYVDSVAVGGVAAGPPSSVQYNNSGPFGGDATFTWASGAQVLAVSGRLVVGSQAAEPGAALALKSDVGPAPVALTGAVAAPSWLALQARATTVGAAAAPLLALRLADRSAAFCELTVIAAASAGVLGATNTFRRRFRASRFDAGGGTTLSAITADFEEVITAGAALAVGVAGTDVVVTVAGAAATTLVWDCACELVLARPW